MYREKIRSALHFIFHTVTGRQRGKLATFIRWGLTPFSWVYGGLVIVRNSLYDWRIRRPKRLPCPVISVGNIVAGGTGKTPMAIWVARYLQSAGFRVAVLLRGYRRKGCPSMAIVSDGKRILTPVNESGDEAAMLARELPGVPVVVGKDRHAAGQTAIRLWGQTNTLRNGALILDDGFQHRQLARDLDIVIIDTTQPFGTGKLLPAGTLREPISTLKRADMVLLTRTDLERPPPNLERFVERERVFESRHHPTRLYRLDTDEAVSLKGLNGQRLLAVCGIGNPEAFVQTLRRYAPQQVELLAFPDHHHYTRSDLCQIRERASRIQADRIVTTQKDAQKLAALEPAACSASGKLPLFVLAIDLEITVNQEAFKQRLRQVITGFQK